MRIQVLNPTTFKPVPPNAVKSFIENGGIKREIVLRVTPSTGSDLHMAQGESENPLYLSSEAIIESIGVSAHADFRSVPGLVNFGISEG